LPLLETRDIVKFGVFELLHVPYTQDLMEKVKQALENSKKQQQRSSHNKTKVSQPQDAITKQLQEQDRKVNETEHKPTEMFFVSRIINCN
jgi:hypothetical protein